MEKELIVVKQLPVIEESLKGLAEEIESKVEIAKSLVCTADTVKDVKATRAEINKQYTELEGIRKEVKKAVMKPYEDFEKVYKEFVQNKFKLADSELKNKIADVEDGLKKEKETAVKSYFEELKQNKNLDIDFERANINVTLSASLKSLKEQAKSFLDKIEQDLQTIKLQEHADEILFEYNQHLDLSKAIFTVADRKKEIEKLKEEVVKEKVVKEKVVKEEGANEEQANLENNPSQEVESETEKAEEIEDILTINITVTATRAKLRDLRAYMQREGINYV